MDGTLRVIWSFSPITSGSSKDRKEKAFPRQQTRKLDLFSYNGHCGIGTNIKEIDSLLNTEETQYSILHLNACHTYRHMPSISPKYDLILNLSKAWFTHMSVSALAVLEGVMTGKSYKAILQSLPKSQGPIVVNENIDSPSPR